MLEKDTFSYRLSRLLEFMENESIDLTILYSDVWRCGNVQYFIPWNEPGGGISQASTILLIPRKATPVLFVGFEMVNDALLRVKNIKIEESRNFESKLKQWKTVERVAICGTNIIPSNYMNHIRSAFINSDITDLTPLVDEWRRIKANWEIDRMKMAAQISDYAILKVYQSLKKGMTEKEIMGIVFSTITEKGSFPAFYPMASVGKNTAIPMRDPGDTKLDSSGLVMIDCGAKYEGYANDITRVIGYGSLNSEEAKILEVAIKANYAGRMVVRPGIRSSEVNLAVRKATIDSGMGDYLVHDSTHGIGIDHEENFPIEKNNDLVLQPNMVFTVESGVYVPGVGGARIEDVVVVTKTGCEELNKMERDLCLN
jgi:Xaa-Pro aminopeptidase